MTWSRLALALVITIGAFFRFTGLNWDSNQHLHPDERFLTMVLAAERWPASVREYLDESRSPLNPRNVGFEYFAYGTLPTTMAKAVSGALGISDYQRLVLVGRSLSALADLGSVLLLFFVARRLYDDVRIALLAAFLLAVCVLPIQHAHFFVVDTFAVLFTTASMWALARGPQSGYLAYVVAGIFFGLALACKISVATFAVVIAAVAWFADDRAWAERGSARFGRLALFCARGAVAGIAAFIVFRLAQPDAFRGPGLLDIAPSARWLADFAQTRRLLTGEIDFPPAVQWANRTPYWYAWKNLVLWGMGPALGVAAWLGWSAAAWSLATRGVRRHLIPVLWVAILFLYLGGQFVTTARYFLPIYPSLILLAAWLLVMLWDRKHTSRLALILGALTAVASLLWAIAFTEVYRRSNTRVQASAWIYENVAPGSHLATEHWDDRLPLRLGDLGPERYASIELTNFDDDTPAKLATLVDRLDAADYVILSSNRLLESIPRLPMRYPMTTRFYAVLLSGELGFRREAEFTSYPRLGPLRIPDQSAEEAFSVYDHARVQIFRKTSAWDAARARGRLGDVDWDAIVKVNPQNARQFKNGLMLAPHALDAVRQGGTWSRLFPRGSPADRWPVPVWIVTLELLGLVAFPLAALVLHPLPDRGWLLSKTVALLLAGYLGWMLASLRVAPFVRSTLVVVCVALTCGASAVLWRQRASYAQFWRARRGLLLGEECLFWTCFAGFLIIRAGNPDLWHPYFGGEKPMDFAFLNAVVRSEYFPPFDPWFAGGYINYYYFGFVLVAVLTKLSGVVPQVAYNLAIPTFFALAAAGVFSVAHAIADRVQPAPSLRQWVTRPFLSGLAAVIFVLGLGNLAEVRLIARAVSEGTWMQVPNWSWYWNATRIVPHAPAEAPPITEFPFFTFLYGDLHAHMLALPYTLLVLAIVVSILLRPAAARGRWRDEVLVLGALALTIGTLYATNTWDCPTYLLIAGAAMTLHAWRAPDREPAWRGMALQAGWRMLFVAAAAWVLFAPFFRHFSEAHGGLQLWTGSRTTPGAYLTIYGFFLFVIASLALCQLVARARRAAWRLVPPLELFLCITIATALALTVFVEFVRVANDVGRMNTVFKFSFQSWVLLGIAAAVSLPALVEKWRSRSFALDPRIGRPVSAAWVMAFVFLFLGCLAYAPLATRARWRDRFDRRVGFTLDGQAYMTAAEHEEQDEPFALATDLEAIRWLQAEIQGTPVIVEGHTPEYRWGGRISVNTGLPTIIGWSWHQRQQRAALPQHVVTRRVADVHAIYADPDTGRIATILDRYRVDYVYVGALERILYPAAGLAKFDADPRRWQRVYASDDVRIYRVAR